jgi:hypothetical protein
MRRGILLVLLLAATTTGVSTALNTTPMDKSRELMVEGGPFGTVLTQDPDGNSSYYLKLIKEAGNQYSEDLGYSSDILDEFVKNNITNREAMVATVSILTLTAQTYDMLSSVQSPDEYVKYQFYMESALKYFRLYLWNMAKFYETNRNEYAVKAREFFNLSIYYYEKSVEEYDLIQRSAVRF